MGTQLANIIDAEPDDWTRVRRANLYELLDKLTAMQLALVSLWVLFPSVVFVFDACQCERGAVGVVPFVLAHVDVPGSIAWRTCGEIVCRPRQSAGTGARSPSAPAQSTSPSAPARSTS